MKGFRGMYITFEGIDGSGKTTQINLLYNLLICNGYKVKKIFEPGYTKEGKIIRDIVLNQNSREGLTDFSELLLFLLDRAETYQKVTKKYLNDGYIILSDRGIDSTIAYQNSRLLDFAQLGNLLALENRIPDLTFLMNVSSENSSQRCNKRSKSDYYDNLNKEQIIKKYLNIALKNPERVHVIDANKSINNIHLDILDILRKEVVTLV